jgi:hypothetical protein
MAKRSSFYLLRALVLLPALAAPAFAEDGRDAPGRASSIMQTVSPTHPEQSELTPFPRQFWKDN